jgi:hypothetical protein
VHNQDIDADCTVAITLENLAALLTGELEPATGFMMGKFKVSGDMSGGDEAAARGVSVLPPASAARLRSTARGAGGGRRAPRRRQRRTVRHRRAVRRVRHHAAHHPLLRGQGPAQAPAHQRHAGLFPRDRARLALILRSKAIGASLQEIKQFLDMYGAHGEGRVQQLTYVLDRTDAAIVELEQKRAHIDATLAELRVINAAVRNKLETK